MGTPASRIFVTWNAVGFHHWPLAMGPRSYLANRHRHVFQFRVELDVLHDDRDIEFHDLLDICHAMTPDNVEWNARSCEAIAHVLRAELEHRWPGRHPMVMVTEDGECGAVVA